MPTRTIVLLLILSGALVFSMMRWAAPPTTLDVHIAEDGTLTLNDDPIAFDDLDAAIDASLAKDPLTRVHIYADAKMPADMVIRISQVAEQAGALVAVNPRAP